MEGRPGSKPENIIQIRIRKPAKQGQERVRNQGRKQNEKGDKNAMKNRMNNVLENRPENRPENKTILSEPGLFFGI